jgi:(p)ppGpp synthase/HD superfamily hydrolase
VGAGWVIPSWEGASPITRIALRYAQQAHAGQRRKADGAEFILHPFEVASLLSDAGAPDHLIAAGALHDVLEKTDATESDLRERFGGTIAALVSAVSENKHIAGYEARKAALRDQVASAGEEALTLFAADKISKARELHLERHDRSRNRRLAHYRRCLALLREHLPGSLLVGQLEAQLKEAPVLANRVRTSARTRARREPLDDGKCAGTVPEKARRRERAPTA